MWPHASRDLNYDGHAIYMYLYRVECTQPCTHTLCTSKIFFVNIRQCQDRFVRIKTKIKWTLTKISK